MTGSKLMGYQLSGCGSAQVKESRPGFGKGDSGVQMDSVQSWAWFGCTGKVRGPDFQVQVCGRLALAGSKWQDPDQGRCVARPQGRTAPAGSSCRGQVGPGAVLATARLAGGWRAGQGWCHRAVERCQGGAGSGDPWVSGTQVSWPTKSAGPWGQSRTLTCCNRTSGSSSCCSGL